MTHDENKTKQNQTKKKKKKKKKKTLQFQRTYPMYCYVSMKKQREVQLNQNWNSTF